MKEMENMVYYVWDFYDLEATWNLFIRGILPRGNKSVGFVWLHVMYDIGVRLYCCLCS